MKEKDEVVITPPPDDDPKPRTEDPNRGFVHYIVTKHMWIIAFLVS